MYTLKIDRETPLAAEITQPPNPEVIIGKSDQMRNIFKTIGLLSQNRAPVLIQGETGTGKELIARVIHRNSLFAMEPFITLDCSAVVETLLESELFGHEKGAFTGATQAKTGKIELAGNGTLFLDEIGELPLTMQRKFLGFYSATNTTAWAASTPSPRGAGSLRRRIGTWPMVVNDGLFRQDLFFRLKVMMIHVPPLVDR